MVEETQKILLSGVQPSGKVHIGNYFGAMKQFAELQNTHTSYFMIADLHALTSAHDGEMLRKNTIDVVKDYLAIGIDPKKAIIFKQSDVLQHTELAWIFECLVTVPFLMQGHAYKDKVAKGLEVNAGLFNYPMLMAADILLYNTDVVPVGSDQRQHVEYAREAATKFNVAYGETFKKPEEKILSAVGVVLGTNGEKMSKSNNNTIPLFGSREEITQAVMGIVTDSSDGRPENVYAIHSLFKSGEELKKLYSENEGKYQVLKEMLIKDIEAFVKPMRERRGKITEDEVGVVLKEGGDRARTIAEKKMVEVRKKIGIN